MMMFKNVVFSFRCLPKWIILPTQGYQTEDLTVSDNTGPLQIIQRDNKGSWKWLASRRIYGGIKVHFVAKPRHVNQPTSVGPHLDLRYDQRGIEGVGITLIPTL